MKPRQSHPPRPDSPGRPSRPLWPLLPPLVAIGLTVFFLTLTRWLGGQGAECGVRKLTGYYCPGCGGTRCATDLSHGDILQAWSHNALLTTGVIVFASVSLYLIVRMTLLGKPAPTINIHPGWFWLALTAAVLFTILRNTPSFAWLAP